MTATRSVIATWTSPPTYGPKERSSFRRADAHAVRHGKERRVASQDELRVADALEFAGEPVDVDAGSNRAANPRSAAVRHRTTPPTASERYPSVPAVGAHGADCSYVLSSGWYPGGGRLMYEGTCRRCVGSTEVRRRAVVRTLHANHAVEEHVDAQSIRGRRRPRRSTAGARGFRAACRQPHRRLVVDSQRTAGDRHRYGPRAPELRRGAVRDPGSWAPALPRGPERAIMAMMRNMSSDDSPHCVFPSAPDVADGRCPDRDARGPACAQRVRSRAVYTCPQRLRPA